MSSSYKPLTDKLPLGEGVHIVEAWDNGLVALNKPEGILSHPNDPTDWHRSLLVDPYTMEGEHYILSELDAEFHLLHRLDSATSGLVLGSLNPELAQVVRKLFKQRKITKTYLAFLKGRPQPKPDLWVDRLDKKNVQGKLRVFSGKGSMAKTHFKILKALSGFSLVELTPVTGFTHQLRVQSALRDHPIIGDKTYGDFRLNKEFAKEQGINRLCLHAWRLSFDLEYKGKKMSIKLESPLPDFAMLI